MVKHFHSLGWTVRGVDNNMRAVFFGSQGTRVGTKIGSHVNAITLRIMK